ncbi:MAG: hypothetical protein CAPSK01_004444 [Candidatus Accumulibacter vicinus]|uniref:Uncharacterized protein n=1 Tax=Candidatus Accumulibacter vicinus TaxID=2954382 RepID=A0A084XUY9_9PROT|nr:MAG: hypothetical protein CAPSK01_004444 [Candidatus Accumulibacter vicinus]
MLVRNPGEFGRNAQLVVGESDFKAIMPSGNRFLFTQRRLRPDAFLGIPAVFWNIFDGDQFLLLIQLESHSRR